VHLCCTVTTLLTFQNFWQERLRKKESEAKKETVKEKILKRHVLVQKESDAKKEAVKKKFSNVVS
jgi:hypothetical protein